MSEELEAKKTPVTPQEMFDVMTLVWPTVFQEEPWKPSVVILVAQWALETGHGKSMWCYNVGNVKAKAVGTYDYCYFTAGEILSTAEAQREAAAHPNTAVIRQTFKSGKCEIYFHPKHPGCCFRAFRTLEDGVMDYLALMKRRFNKAWPYVKSADPRGFCHALKLQQYYTADEAPYTRNVMGYYNKFLRTLLDAEPSVVIPVPALTEFQASSLHDANPDDSSPILSVYSFEWARAELESPG